MDENKVRQIIQEELQKFTQKSQYSVANVPIHTHNNIDSPNLIQHSVVGFQALPSVVDTTSKMPGIANPQFLNGQSLAFGDVFINTNSPQYTNIYTYPLPIIYGYGTTTSDTLTAIVSTGAVSATLTGAWGGTTGTYSVQFSSTEVRNVLFTNSSTAITWTPALLTGATANIDIIANARFKGGEAPYGTAVIFRNDDDNIYQLWVRTQPGIVSTSWTGVDLGGTGLFIYT